MDIQYFTKYLVMIILIAPFSRISKAENNLNQIKQDDRNFEYIHYDIKFPSDQNRKLPDVKMSTSGTKYLPIPITDVHSAITKKALSKFVSDDCLKIILESNRGQDSGENSQINYFHFDDNTICEGSNQIEKWIILMKKNTVKKQMEFMGKVLHSVQDFYAHSNYLENSIKNGKISENLELEPLELSSKKCKSISKQYFTGNNHGEETQSIALIPQSHLEDPKSHLYWNKDFSPRSDNYYAKMYSRSSCKKYKGKTYFDIIFETQVQHTKNIFLEYFPRFNKSIKCN